MPGGEGLNHEIRCLQQPLEHCLAVSGLKVKSYAALAGIEAEVKKYCTGKIIRARYAPKGAKRIIDGEVFKLNSLIAEPVTAVSAIGENSGFKKLLEKTGINAVEQLDFRDHHWYNLDDIKSIAPGRKVVTTTKDAVRLKNLLAFLPVKEAERFYALEIELNFINGAKIWENGMEKKLRSSSTVTVR